MSNKVTILDRDPNDSWAEVELWRWQYGELPKPTDNRPLSIAKGLEGMAAALERDPKINKWPEPYNIASVLRYVAKTIEKRKAT